MILIGDHQPPALVSGEGVPWDVPVHVITSREEVLNALLSSGFQKRPDPRRPSLGKMHTLTPYCSMHSARPRTNLRILIVDRNCGSCVSPVQGTVRLCR